MNETIAEKLKLLPSGPGVYQMKDASGTVIYVGKAISLKNRVRQYFQSARGKEPKVLAMVEHIADFEYILTDNETEALALESNLIKELRPHYNILLKDDKHFPYVRIDFTRPYPRLEVVRQVRKDSAKYYGPYISGIALREALDAAAEAFPMRQCKKDIGRALQRGERPCLMHHIGRCCAPCAGKISRSAYADMVRQVGAFLSGKSEDMAKTLRAAMERAAEGLDFERAAALRDRLAALSALGAKQKAIETGLGERDILAFARSGADALMYAMFMRAGKMIGAERYEMLAPDESPGEVTESFMQQFYVPPRQIPREILVRDLPDNHGLLAEWLGSLKGAKVLLTQPQKGTKKRIVDMAYQNGMEALTKAMMTKRREWERHEGALAALAGLLGLDALPVRIEAFDNSNIQGRDAVAAMIVFQDGRPAPKEYRRFRIKTVEGANDVASMREVLTRRLNRLAAAQEKFAQPPDLILIDGGAGQLGAALAAMEETGVFLPVAALAERLEEVYLPGGPPIRLDRTSPALHLLQRVRDEAHRFAITYHRSLRAKNTLFSVLDEIPHIGPKRRKALFDAFASLDAIKQADAATLAKVKGMDRVAAEAVTAYFLETANEIKGKGE